MSMYGVQQLLILLSTEYLESRSATGISVSQNIQQTTKFNLNLAGVSEVAAPLLLDSNDWFGKKKKKYLVSNILLDTIFFFFSVLEHITDTNSSVSSKPILSIPQQTLMPFTKTASGESLLPSIDLAQCLWFRRILSLIVDRVRY